MDEVIDLVRPGTFCRQLLQSMEASEGRRRKRKRDTRPDAIGMTVKRDILLRAAEEDPEPEEFEEWLLEQVLVAPASGPVRALCISILDEYQVVGHDVRFREWLAEGAPSADAESGSGQKACGSASTGCRT